MTELEKEIEKIRYELAVTIPEELQNATYSGDILESSEYSEILTRQHLLSVRLTQLNKRLHAMAHVNIRNIPRNQVGIGSLITLLCKITNVEHSVKLISSEMSDTRCDEITLNSPIGKAIYNKQLYDDVTVYTPSGIKYYKIIGLVTIHDVKNTT